MEKKIDDIYTYVQERCLWQFFSRTWDRQENIDRTIAYATDLFSGRTPEPATAMDKCHLVDAKQLVADCRERFSWVALTPAEEMQAVLEGVKEKLIDVTITQSRNRELNMQLY